MQRKPQDAGSFPEIITFHKIDRPHRSGQPRIADVKCAIDLPSRFLLGDLVPESFVARGSDWSARYEDADGHSVDLERKDGHLWIRQTFHGSETTSAGAFPTFVEMGRLLSIFEPGVWDAILRERLEPTCNVRVFPQEAGQVNVCGVPDGFMRSILFPVPADRLGDLAEFHRALAADETIRSPGSGIARLQDSVVNYVEGRNSEFLATAMGPVLGHMDALGTPALAAAKREEGGDGTAAWTLHRRHYLYVGTFFLRDIERVVGQLHRAGFIGKHPADAWEEVWPDAPEHGAFVLPAQLVPFFEKVSWFDHGTRGGSSTPDSAGWMNCRPCWPPTAKPNWRPRSALPRQRRTTCVKSLQKSSPAQGRHDMNASFHHDNPYSLYPHQLEGVSFLKRKGRAILGDDMGLGKTRQAIVALREASPGGLPAGRLPGLA